jgi:RND family efflux transporter MFP subunit
MTNTRRFTAIALAAVGALTALVVLRAGGVVARADVPAASGPPPAAVKVGVAQSLEMTAVLSAPASVVSRSDARVGAEVPGQLLRVAEVGEVVRQGDVIAQIDNRGLRLRLEESEAEIRRLEANRDYLVQQVSRLNRLGREGIVAAEDLDQARSQRQTAAEALAQAMASRDNIAYQLERTQVQAPFSGRVAERLLQTGSYAAVGSEIVRLVDTRRVEVRARAPLGIASFLREGMGVTVSDADQRLEGRIRTVVPVGDERSRQLEVRIELPDAAWLIGSAVRVALPTSAARQVVAVPRDALVLRRDNTFIFKIDANGAAQRVEVETGVGRDELIEVRGDVAAGDRVILRGGERLRPGQPLNIIETQAG